MLSRKACFISRTLLSRHSVGGWCHMCITPSSSTAPTVAQSPTTTRDITATTQRALKISRQMKLYLEKKQRHDDFIKEEEAEYEIGRRHLANIMGADPETFTQQDINKAIEYLLPSGLFHKGARPVMVHPSKLFPPEKDAQFDSDGRPFHFLFYTGKPNFYQIMHDIESHHYALNKLEDEMRKQNKMAPNPDDMLSLEGYNWIRKEQLEAMIMERVQDHMFNNFVTCMTRLTEHPYSYKVKDFIMGFFNKLPEATSMVTIPEIHYDPDGKAYTESYGKRKSCATAFVTCHAGGTGHFFINNQNIYQSRLAVDIREVILYPLAFTRLLGQVNVNATVWGPPIFSRMARAGAIRHGLSMCLTAFVSDDLRERMRQAGLLQRDVRRKERKKPGQPKARKKKTWRKR